MDKPMDVPGFRLGIVAVALLASFVMACAWAIGALSAETGLKIAGVAGAAGLWVLPDVIGVRGESEGEGGAHG